MANPFDPRQKAFDAERNAESLHNAGKRLAVLAANAERKGDAESMIGLAQRAEEMIVSANALIQRLREVRHIGNFNYRQIVNGPDPDDAA